MDLAALRIDALEYALDGAILARRIHALKDQKHRPAILRVKLFLKIDQPFLVGFENLFRAVLVETALLIGLVRLEMKLARSVETEWRDKRLQLVCERLRGLLAHGSESSGLRLKRYTALAVRARPAAPQLRKLPLDKGGDKWRHRRGEIARLAHQMDR